MILSLAKLVLALINEKPSLTCESIATFVVGGVIALSAPKTYADVTTQLQYQQDSQAQRLFGQSDISKQPTQSSPVSINKLQLPNSEAPCFVIDSISLDTPKKDIQHFHFLHRKLNKATTGIKGQCIGSDGLQEIIRFSQHLLINKGFVTSKVLLKPQDLNNRHLILTIVVGKVAKIYRTLDDKFINLHNAMTIKEGDVLNLRQLEQNTQNLRLPKDTKIAIAI